jgi:hypothetical protein
MENECFQRGESAAPLPAAHRRVHYDLCMEGDRPQCECKQLFGHSEKLSY